MYGRTRVLDVMRFSQTSSGVLSVGGPYVPWGENLVGFACAIVSPVLVHEHCTINVNSEGVFVTVYTNGIVQQESTP